MHRVAADASVFHAIADPTRRAVLDVLRDGEAPVKSLLEAIGASQSALSQHLAVLRRAGLVTVRKAGRLRVYALRAEPLEEIAEWVSGYDRFWEESLTELGAYLRRTHGPPRRGEGR